jgi:hypothetical protein
MAQTKRAAGGDAMNPHARKRPRKSRQPLPSATTTDGTLDALNASNADTDVNIGRGHLIALTAYLYIILTWGYPIHSKDLDAFILRYATYEASIEESGSRPPPSYHQWFLTTCNGHHAPGVKVLNASRLRAIAVENPFYFLWAELTLRQFAEHNALVLLARDWDAAVAAWDDGE